jgi:hypothetical protein
MADKYVLLKIRESGVPKVEIEVLDIGSKENLESIKKDMEEKHKKYGGGNRFAVYKIKSRDVKESVNENKLNKMKNINDKLVKEFLYEEKSNAERKSLINKIFNTKYKNLNPKEEDYILGDLETKSTEQLEKIYNDYQSKNESAYDLGNPEDWKWYNNYDIVLSTLEEMSNEGYDAESIASEICQKTHSSFKYEDVLDLITTVDWDDKLDLVQSIVDVINNVDESLNESYDEYSTEEFSPDGTMILNNWGGIEVQINNSGDGLRYRYNYGEEPDEVKEAEIEWFPDPDTDEEANTPDGDEREYLAGFKVEGEDEPYFLRDFMRTNR